MGQAPKGRKEGVRGPTLSLGTDAAWTCSPSFKAARSSSSKAAAVGKTKPRIVRRATLSRCKAVSTSCAVPKIQGVFVVQLLRATSQSL